MIEQSTLTRRKAFLLAGAGLAAPAAAQVPVGRRGIVVAMPAHPAVLDPALLTQTPVRRVSHNIFDTLLAFDWHGGMGLRPALAQRWERVDDRSVRLHLRQGVTFHNGGSFTADDVAFSFGAARLAGPADRGGRTTALQVLDRIERVAVEDPSTVLIVANGPDALLEQRLAAWGSQIVSKRAFEEAGSWARWLAAPVGSGPYQLSENLRDSRVLLTAHEGWWGGRPPVERVDFRIVSELSARVAGLRAGDYDLVTDVPPDNFAEIAQQPALEVAGGAINNIRVLVLDTAAPAMRDVRIRQAISLAIDRELIVRSLWDGRIDVPRGLQLEGFRDTYIADYPRPTYNPEAARRLLREAGYARQPIAYKVLPNFYPNQLATAQILVEMWRSVGLDVRIEVLESFAQIYRAPIHAIFDSSITADILDPIGQAWRAFGPSGEYQSTASVWTNDEFNRVGTAMQATVDTAARQSAHRRMLDILTRDAVPVVPLHTTGLFYGVRRGLPWRPIPTLAMDFRPVTG